MSKRKKDYITETCFCGGSIQTTSKSVWYEWRDNHYHDRLDDNDQPVQHTYVSSPPLTVSVYPPTSSIGQ